MNPKSKLNLLQNSVYKCINHYFNMDVSDVPIVYVNEIDFYKYLKTNSDFPPIFFEKIKDIKQFYQFAVET